MSGSAGGNRIKRELVEETVQNYRVNILAPFEPYMNSQITGSYHCVDKEDFGDIDLIVQMHTYHNKAAFKKQFAKYLSTFPDDIIIPFKSEKYKGKKYKNTGEIITILYSIVGTDEYVQIDNIVALSYDELLFKHKFLSVPAIKQGLMLGLIKTYILEHPDDISFNEICEPDKGQELEFTLSSSMLSLRLVDITPDFKITNKETIWSSPNWHMVHHLLKDYDLSGTFDECLTNIKKTIKHPRSINRIKGLFKSMVSIKSGEIGTLKGLEKQEALNKILQL